MRLRQKYVFFLDLEILILCVVLLSEDFIKDVSNDIHVDVTACHDGSKSTALLFFRHAMIMTHVTSPAAVMQAAPHCHQTTLLPALPRRK